MTQRMHFGIPQILAFHSKVAQGVLLGCGGRPSLGVGHLCDKRKLLLSIHMQNKTGKVGRAGTRGVRMWATLELAVPSLTAVTAAVDEMPKADRV